MQKRNMVSYFIILLLLISLSPLTLRLIAQTGPLNGNGGGIIAFTSDRDGQSEIYFVNADGSNQTRISNTPAGEHSPKWSPDGSKLAYRADGGIYILNIVDLPNGLVSEPQLVIAISGASFEWTPDEKIIFDSPASGNWDIYLVNTDGSNLTNITNSEETVFDPDVSPDGSKIVFVKGYNLWIMDIDGSNQIQLTELQTDFAPAWSPDGGKIAFISGTGMQNLEICTISPDGTNKQWITDSPYLDEFPSWSPDGLKIAYENDQDNKEKIYAVNVDGTNPTQLTNSGFNDGSPDWRPDSPSSVDELNENYTPQDFKLYQNYPNPFNPTTNISYNITESSFIQIKIYDTIGNEIQTLVNSSKHAGQHSAIFDATAFPSGIYIYELLINGCHSKSKKMCLLK